MNKYSLPTLSQFLEETDAQKLQYMLGGYKQTAQHHIQNNQLYPVLQHTHKLVAECDEFLASINAIDSIIPTQIVGILPNYSIKRQSLEYDDVVDKQYKKTVFVKKHASSIQSTYVNAYRHITSMLHWDVIGLHACFPSEGILFTQFSYESLVDTYQFVIQDIVGIDDKKIVRLEYKETWEYSFSNTFVQKKHEYIKKLSHISSIPACVLVTWPEPLPKEQTVLPLIQHLLPKQLESYV